MEGYNIGFKEVENYNIVEVIAHAQCKFRKHDKYIGYIHIKSEVLILEQPTEGIELELLLSILYHWGEFKLDKKRQSEQQ